MGFGYGRTTHWNYEAHDSSGKRVRKVYDSSMVAHVWNAESQDFARTSNGNFAFLGKRVYSYGTGWIVATRFAGAALINGRKYSVTTSGHESDARGACRNRIRFDLPDLDSAFANRLDAIESAMVRKQKAHAQKLARDAFAQKDWREVLKAERVEPGEYWARPSDDSGNPIARQPLGSFIAEHAGIKPAEYLNAAARLDRQAEREAEAAKRAEHKRFIANAIRLADMGAADWREHASFRDSYYRGDKERLASDLRRARLKAGLSKTRRARLWAREKRLREKLADFDRYRAIESGRSRLASLVRFARQASTLLAIQPDRPLTVWSRQTWQTMATNFAELSACAMLPAGSRVRLARLAEACKAEAYNAECRENAEREAERAALAERRALHAAEREALQAEHRRAWLAGEPTPAGGFALGHNWSREDQTPYLRIAGNELQTSWGATVPLAHAIKVFRFVKLCRERGESWQRNGKTIRVGHFQVDSIAANGDFVAGCHRFAWQEIERAAALAGVLESAADDSALEVTSAA